MTKHIVSILLLSLAPTLLAATPPMPITQVRTFMYQLQNIESPAALQALADSPYDMLVIEPTADVKGNEKFDIHAAVAKLHAAKPGRLVIAYLDAAQAESFRTYWTPDWKPPTKTSRGTPDFLLIPDPDGWSDDYNVAFWDKRWQAVFATSPDSEVHAAMRAGFDGVYLDWIDAFDEDTVQTAAKKENIDPAHAMVDFLLQIRAAAREINPDAIVIQQNAYGLIDRDPRLTTAIDAIGIEDTWFGGKSNAPWTSKSAGDLPNKSKGEDSTPARLRQYQKFTAAGKPVFTIDYCLNPANAAQVYKSARAHNLIPLVTRVSLDQLTTTLPSKATVAPSPLTLPPSTP